MTRLGRVLRRRRKPRAAKPATRPVRRRRRVPDPEALLIEARITAGADPESFLCVECDCWLLEPAYCLCRERPIW